MKLKSLKSVTIGYDKDKDPIGYKEIQDNLLNGPIELVSFQNDGAIVSDCRRKAFCIISDIRDIIWKT